MRWLVPIALFGVLSGCAGPGNADPYILEGSVSQSKPYVFGNHQQSLSSSYPDSELWTFPKWHDLRGQLVDAPREHISLSSYAYIDMRNLKGYLLSSHGRVTHSLDPSDPYAYGNIWLEQKTSMYESTFGIHPGRIELAGWYPTAAFLKFDLTPAEFWKTNIEIEGPQEDSAALIRHLFYLRTFGPQRDGSVPGVFSTGSMKYKGHIFWDHDVWIFPALMLLDPEAAKSIPEMRLKQVSQAAINAKDSGGVGLKFPWETDESGKELTQGNNVKQIHINGDVSLGLRWAAWLGLAPDEKVVEVEKGVGEYFTKRMKVRTYQNMGVWFGFEDIIGPDEFHTVNDDLYTMIVAEKPINTFDREVEYYNPSIPNGGTNMQPFREVNPNTLLAYAGDPLQNYQQASAILTAWPAQNPYFEEIAVPMVRRFGPQVTKNGPAMTKSVEALLLARFGDADEAHKKWRESFETYEKGPLKLFCENPKSTDGPFLTGIAGCLNAVIYGFAGVRLDKEPWPDAVWKKQLKSGAWVSIRPNLPSAWKRLTLTRIWLDGVAYRVEIVGKKVTVTAL